MGSDRFTVVPFCCESGIHWLSLPGSSPRMGWGIERLRRLRGFCYCVGGFWFLGGSLSLVVCELERLATACEVLTDYRCDMGGAGLYQMDRIGPICVMW